MSYTTFSSGTKAKASEVNNNFFITSSRGMSAADSLAQIHTLQFTLAAGTVTLTRGVPYYFSSFNMTGGTITATGTGGEPLILIVDGDVTFSGGTINMSGLGYAGGTPGSGNGANGGNGEEYSVNYHIYFKGKGNGGNGQSGGSTPGAITSYYTLTSSAYEPDDLINAFNVVSGAGGGAGGNGAGANYGTGGAGGAGGGSVIFLCNGAFDATGGTINVSGATGTNGSDGGGSPGAGGGGGGGGAAGTIVIGYKDTYLNPTLSYSGGAGGTGGTGAGTLNGAGAGGAGGSAETSGEAGGVIADDVGGVGGAGGDGKVYVFQL